jgi:hypothetical protein
VVALHTKCLQQDGPLQELWYAVGDGHILLMKKKELFSEQAVPLNKQDWQTEWNKF